MRPEVIIFIAIVVVYFLASTILRHYLDVKIQALYSAGLYDDAFKTLNTFFARILLPTFRQYTLRFMVHEARGEREMATRMMELMLRMRNSKKRQAQVTVMGFNYFITIDDKKRAKELLSDVKQRCDQTVAADCQLTYDIMCGKRHDYIERMEGMLDSADPALKSKLYLLIAKQYRNAGDAKSAKKYEQMLDDLAKEFEASMPTAGIGGNAGNAPADKKDA